MLKVCEVCGHGGETDQNCIATCCRCWESHEHVYCMKAKCPINVWICESCECRDSVKEDKLLLSPRKQVAKPTGKVKFIAEDEVKRLASAATNLAFAVRNTRSRKPFSRPNTTICVTSKASSSSPQSPATKLPTRIKSLKHVYNSPKPAQANVSPGSVKIKSMSPTASTDLPLVITQGVQLEDLPLCKRFMSVFSPYLPSLDGNWKGGISIVDAFPGEIFEGFQAQPPSQVLGKVYALLQKMPPTLELNMLPRAKYMSRVCLDLTQLGFYVFPSDTAQRSRFDTLFARMEMKETVLVGHVDGIELIIFTSKQIKVDYEMNNFLWGLFRLVKRT